MKTIQRFLFNIALVLPLLFIATMVVLPNAYASSENEGYSGYDSIVKDLTTTHYSTTSTDTDTMDEIKFHAGIGVVTSRINFDLPKGLPDSATLRGYELRLGIDLFSPRWVAEGAVRSFDPEQVGTGTVSMREFDLIVKYNSLALKPLDLTVGGGMTARYLDFSSSVIGDFPKSNTTPASVFLVGLGANVSSAFTLGVQLSYRSPLTKETIDKGSIDGAFRVASHF